MRVLVDTSVWSLFFRKAGPADHPAVHRLAGLVEDDQEVLLSGLILQEILQAFRTEKAARKVASHLEPFSLLELRRADYLAAAELYRLCRSRGITVATADCQIAATAMAHDCLLLTTDRDFERIAGVSSLQLLPYEGIIT